MFLKNIVDDSFGGVIEAKRNEFPVQFPAEIYIKNYTDKDKEFAFAYNIKNRKINRRMKSYLERVSEDLFSNFLTLTVYVGYSTISIYKNVANQYLFPIYSEKKEYCQNRDIVNWIGTHMPVCLNLVIGEIDDIQEVNNLILSGVEQINLYMFDDVFKAYGDLLVLKDNCKINIWKLFPGKIDENGIFNVSYYFLVENEKDIAEQEKYGYNDNVYIVPFYNGKNIAFCKKYLSFSYREVLDSIDNDYYFRTNRILNSSMFGDIRIMPDGKVYTNINESALGNVFDFSLRDILFIEIAKVRNWFETRRNVEPCCNCLYSDLCPPISDFENFSKKYKLCRNFANLK